VRAFSNGELVNPSRGRYYLLFVKTRYLKHRMFKKRSL
jgi:hypothetical protein